ncbi:nicotinamide riboside transporter PnuC [Flavobacterium sp. HJ-32-4]|nr:MULTISPECIES: nicotinamide riboside transporter PnuC [unclassified Flavobacterium]UMY66061.1 nicotinamide riboside transporter PnuC [Flavobacterium sp. HJ-32-4]
MDEIVSFLLNPYRDRPVYAIVLEALTFVLGIASVWLARKTHILTYPVGLIATAITAWLLYEAGYLGDMSVNIYFTLMSFYGWYRWSKNRNADSDIAISRTTKREKIAGFGLFCLTIVVIFGIYAAFDMEIETANYIDILTSGLFFTAMWFMALKKIENWTLWIVGDCIAVPLYWHRGLGILALEYVVFTALAIMAYQEWRTLLKHKTTR